MWFILQSILFVKSLKALQYLNIDNKKESLCNFFACFIFPTQCAKDRI